MKEIVATPARLACWSYYYFHFFPLVLSFRLLWLLASSFGLYKDVANVYNSRNLNSRKDNLNYSEYSTEWERM